MADPLARPTYSNTQERLILATLATINEVGIENATTRRIAELAEVNLQLIQYHFGGKDAMIEEAQRYLVDRFFEQLSPAIIGAPSLVEAVRRGVAATWRLAQSHPEIVQPDLLIQSVRARPGESGSTRERQAHRRLGRLLADVADRTGESLRVPQESFVVLVAAGLSGLVLDYRATGERKRVEGAVEMFSQLLVSLVEPAAKPRPASRGAARKTTAGKARGSSGGAARKSSG